jgi:hypothetical protein
MFFTFHGNDLHLIGGARRNGSASFTARAAFGLPSHATRTRLHLNSCTFGGTTIAGRPLWKSASSNMPSSRGEELDVVVENRQVVNAGVGRERRDHVSTFAQFLVCMKRRSQGRPCRAL